MNIGKALLEVNPCGVEGRPSTHCRYYDQECSSFRRNSIKFICLSKLGYQVAGYLRKGSDVETERKHLRDFVSSYVGKIVVDPTQKDWTPIELQPGGVDRITEEILSRGQQLYNRVRDIASNRDPMNFYCGVDHIIDDL